MTTTDLCNHANFGEIEGGLAKAISKFQVSDLFWHIVWYTVYICALEEGLPCSCDLSFVYLSFCLLFIPRLLHSARQLKNVSVVSNCNNFFRIKKKTKQLEMLTPNVS